MEDLEQQKLTFLKIKSVKMENLYNYLSSLNENEEFDENAYQEVRQMIIDNFYDFEQPQVRNSKKKMIQSTKILRQKSSEKTHHF